MRPICDRLGKKKSLVVFSLLSVVMEVVCSITHLPDFVYRLLCIRYVFLIWCGWIWVKEGIRLNALTISASLVSLVAIIYFAYFGQDLEPLFYNTGWSTHRWICYFWVGYTFAGFLHWIYTKVSRNEWINRAVKMLASASYEIFLVQMAYYAIIPLKSLSFIGNQYLQFIIWFAMAFVLSIVGGNVLNRYEKKAVSVS